MALSFIGYHGAAGTSVATVNAVGDLLLVRAFRSGSATPPSLPGTFTPPITAPANGGGGSNNSAQIGWRRATATNEGSGTWTNATAVEVIVLRGALVSASPIGGIAEDSPNATSAIITYPAIILAVTDGSSALVGFGARTTTGAVAGVATAPGTMANAGSTPATPYCATHYELGRSTNWTATDVTPGGTNVKPIGVVLEVLAEPDPPADQGVDLPTLASTLALFALAVASAITLPAIASAEQTFAPTVSATGSQLDVVIEIREGATVRVTRTFPDLAPGLDDYPIDLTETERDSFTDLSAATLRVIADGIDRARVTNVRFQLVTIGADQGIDLPTVGSTAALFTPALAYAVTLPAIGSTAALHPPSAAHAVTLPTIGLTSAVFAPSVAAAVTGGTIPSGAQLFAPMLASQVDLAAISSGTTLFPPMVMAAGSVSLPTIPSGAVLSPPVLAYGVALSTIPTGSTVTPPSLAAAQAASLPAIASGAILSPPSLAAVVSLPTMAAGSLLTAPSLAYAVTGPSIPSGSAVFPPAVALEQDLALPFLPSGAVLFPPSVSEATTQALALPTIGSTVVLGAPAVAPLPPITERVGLVLDSSAIAVVLDASGMTVALDASAVTAELDPSSVQAS